jgi:hypothetical protein
MPSHGPSRRRRRRSLRSAVSGAARRKGARREALMLLVAEIAHAVAGQPPSAATTSSCSARRRQARTRGVVRSAGSGRRRRPRIGRRRTLCIGAVVDLADAIAPWRPPSPQRCALTRACGHAFHELRGPCPRPRRSRDHARRPSRSCLTMMRGPSATACSSRPTMVLVDMGLSAADMAAPWRRLGPMALLLRARLDPRDTAIENAEDEGVLEPGAMPSAS